MGHTDFSPLDSRGVGSRLHEVEIKGKIKFTCACLRFGNTYILGCCYCWSIDAKEIIDGSLISSVRPKADRLIGLRRLKADLHSGAFLNKQQPPYT